MPEACPRCEFLDGRRRCDREIISLLRELGGLTLKELEFETNRPARSILLSLRKLEGSGRVLNRAQTGGRGPGLQANVYHLVESA